MILEVLLVVTRLLGVAPAPAQTNEDRGFVAHAYRAPDGQETAYYVFVPYDYKGDKPYPLIVYMHGSGERGTDGKKATMVGLGRTIRGQEQTFPFLVLFPQTKSGDWKAESPDGPRTMAILDEVQKIYRVDPRQVFITGMSSGGDGTFSFAVKYPDRWAAMVPVCGNGDPKDAPKIKDIPCWYFMGSADNRGWVQNAHDMVKALKEAGGKPIFTEYPGMGHGIWGKVYGTPELYDWLRKQHRK